MPPRVFCSLIPTTPDSSFSSPFLISARDKNLLPVYFPAPWEGVQMPPQPFEKRHSLKPIPEYLTNLHYSTTFNYNMFNRNHLQDRAFEIFHPYGSLFLIVFLLFALNSCSNDDSPNPISGEGVFQTTSGTATIEGELFLPAGDGPFPTLIIIVGSGNEPRQELEPFAEILNQNGYAAYIYDKRGIGGSTGSYPTETPTTQTEFLTARAQDVVGIIDLLKIHLQIDRNRIGVMGSSQGAWVNSIVHSMSTDLSYIIMSSGGVASTGIEGFYCSLTDDPSISIDDAINQLSDYDGPLGFDPINIITGMPLPVLWIYGNEDRSHPVRYDVDVLTSLDKNNFTVFLYPNADHDLNDLTTGQWPTDLIPNLGMWLEENN